MIMVGIFQGIAGLVALFRQTYFVLPESGLVVSVSYNSWGWLHLIWGIFLVLAGAGVLAGQTWARVVAIILAGLSAVINIAFLAAQPVWSTIIIALDVLVIYALTVHGSEMKSGAAGY